MVMINYGYGQKFPQKLESKGIGTQKLLQYEIEGSTLRQFCPTVNH